MSIKVDMDRAKSEVSYAKQIFRAYVRKSSDKSTRYDVNVNQIDELKSYWAAELKMTPDEVFTSWTSTDNTKYVITEDEKSSAYNTGRSDAQEAAGGFDGHKQSTGRVVSDAAGAAVNATMAVAGKAIGGVLRKSIGKVGESKFLFGTMRDKNLIGTKFNASGKKGTVKAQSNNKSMSDIATVIIATATNAVYMASKPNKDQHEAALELMSSSLPEAQSSLETAQSNMQEATEKTSDLTEQAQDANDKANENIENEKTNFDFFRKQYEYLKDKMARGEQLTEDEKATFEKLAPLMQESVDNIGDLQDDASDAMTDVSEEIEGYQDTYDESAETVAEVQGVTDYAAGFDSSSRTMSYVEMASQEINAVTAGAAATRLATKANISFGASLVFAAMGTAAAAYSQFKAVPEQYKFAKDFGDEIGARKDVQSLESDTQDIYNEEIDNFAGNLEAIDDLELEVPEDLELPEDLTTEVPEDETDGTEGTDGTGSADGTDGTSGAKANGAAGSGEDGSTSGGIGDSPSYQRIMGNGSDYSKILTGEWTRSEYDSMVTNPQGKVILSKAYANVIEKVTGDRSGKPYSKELVPQIISTLLGSPFTVEMINKVRKGENVDSEFAAQIKNVKSGAEESGKVDNTDEATKKAREVINFYWPIFEQAAAGWVEG